MLINPVIAQERLGEIIRLKRKELGYSQEAFASVCGVTAPVWGR
jgi:transcriptional regulator with XRE-family HTH domain